MHAVVQYVDVSALLLSGWFFTCKPRPAVQEYGEGEHDLYGGDARVSGWPTLSGARSDGLCGGPTLGTRGDGLFQPGWV